MIAFLRDVGARLDRRDVAHNASAPVDLKLARKQHTAFADSLKALGVTIQALPPLADQPDGTIVGDAAIVLPEVVVMARPSVAARIPEIESAARVLAEHRPLMRLIPPAFLDAGDVIRIGRTLFVGQSSRTNPECIEALHDIVEPFGYEVRAAELRDGVRLKCACSFIPPDFFVANPAWVNPTSFGRHNTVTVDEREQLAANTFTIAGTTLIPAGSRRLEERLRELGIAVRSVDVSEFHKVEAGLSGLCLLLEPRAVRPAEAAPVIRSINPAATRMGTDCFSPAIVHGGLVYASGQLPVDPITNKPVENDIEAQTAQVLRNLGEVLATSGSALPQTLKLTFYVADLKVADRVKAVCARAFGTHRPTGLFVVAKSLEAGCLIALDAIAAVADE
jgi:dimethylargininase